MKTYSIPEFGITVQVDLPRAGTIESGLKEHLVGDDPTNDPELEAVVNTIESMVLGHASAGIDVASPAYVEGLRSSLDAIANHYS